MMILAHALPLTLVGDGGGDLGIEMAGTEGNGAVLTLIKDPAANLNAADISVKRESSIAGMKSPNK